MVQHVASIFNTALNIEFLSQARDEALGERDGAQRLSPLLDLSRRDDFDTHLHQRQYQRLLISLEACEKLGRKRSLNP